MPDLSPSVLAWISSFYVWARLAIILIIVGFFGTFAFLMFLAAALERRRFRALVKADAQKEAKIAVKSREVISAAISNGFADLGLYTDGDKGIKEGLVSLLLSPDQLVLVWVQHGLARRTKLISQLTCGRWIIIADLRGKPDLTGFDVEEIRHRSSFPQLLEFHSAWMRPQQEMLVPFQADTLPSDLVNRAKTKTQRLVDMGFAPYRSKPSSHEVWSYTFRGAVAVSKRSVLNLTATVKSATK